MVLNNTRRIVILLAVTAVAALVAGATAPAHAQVYMQGGPQDLFYNYYVPPVNGGAGAQLYLCPRPTPPMVGHTYITYQPLMPHEFLYHHERTYITFHPDAPPTRTHICWGGSQIGQDLQHFFIGYNTKLCGHGLSDIILRHGPN